MRFKFFLQQGLLWFGVVIVVMIGLTYSNTTNWLLAQSAGTVSSTTTFDGSGDIDDMAIWIHPTNPLDSLVIGSDKGGETIFVWDIEGGSPIQTVSPGRPGNIDLRYGFPITASLSGPFVDILAVNIRDANRNIVIYAIDPSTRRLTQVDDGKIQSNGEPYGLCLGKHNQTNKWYVFKTAKDGVIEQIELTARNGQVSGTVVRSFDNGGQTEGCVVDDAHGYVYLGEEAGTLWRYNLDPDTGSTRVAIDGVGQNLRADVEGHTIYHTSGNKNYLILSSQGVARFDVLEYTTPAGPYTYKGAFAISGVSGTDGIDVTNVPTTDQFGQGLFIAHDGSATSRLSAVRWQDIAGVLGLSIDTSRNPRTGVGSGGVLPTVSLNVSPQSIIQGQTATLTWSAANATSCTASGGWSGAKATTGTQVVSPTQTTTYSLTCTGSQGSTQASATVNVGSAPTVTINSFTASPTIIQNGQSSSLTWSAANATSCTASGGWSGGKNSTGTQSVSPAQTTTYMLTCVGANNSTDQAQVTVQVQSVATGVAVPQITGPTASPFYATSQSSVQLTGTVTGGQVQSIRYTNSATGQSGAINPAISWSQSIPLGNGLNVISVIVTNTSGVPAADVILVTR